MERPPTHSRRRAFFGLNAGVAAMAAISAVILVNWLVWWQYAATPPSVKKFIRYDLSSTRAHSLSPQTRRVLARLNAPLTLAAVFQDDGVAGSELAAARRRNLEDLMEEYARANGQITARSVNVGAQLGAQGGVDALAKEVADRFQKETHALRLSLEHAHAELANLEGALANAAPPLARLAEASFARERDQVQARTVSNTIVLLRQKLTLRIKEAKAGLARPMPDYLRLQQAADDLAVAAFTDLQACRRTLENTLEPGAKNLDDRSAAIDGSAALKAAIPLCQKADGILRSAAVPAAYEEARRALATGESLVVLTPHRARVVPGSRLFRRVTDSLARSGATATDTGREQFTGEEQITGALVSLAQVTPPRVVFLQGDTGYALNQNGGEGMKPGLFQAMADRLAAMDFQVSEINVWSPRALDEKGEPRGLQAEQGDQRTVWVMCPFREPSLKQAASISMDSRAKTCAFLEKKLAQGDAALILLQHDPLPDPERTQVADQALGKASANAHHPVFDLLKRHGIEARLWEVLAHEEQEPGLQPVPVITAHVQNYPQGTALAKAVEGLSLRLEAPMPLRAAVPLPAGTWVHELVALRLPRLYALGYDALHGDGSRAFNAATATPYAAVALSSEDAKGARLIAVGDPMWATDAKTTFGFHPDLAPAALGGAVGMTTTPGGTAAWPGNAELFVNSIYWLAHQEDLIAPGARSQDVRRIGPMTPLKSTALRWLLLAGLPGLAAAAGIAVALRRRKF